MPESIHVPVLLTEVLTALAPRAGDIFIDGTLGGGGYTTALSQAVGPTGKVIAFDLDGQAIARYQKIAPKNVILIQANYVDLKKYVPSGIHHHVAGCVFDLGLSSDQLQDASRGFSFQVDQPLDMRFNPTGGQPSASDLLNSLSEKQLADIFRSYADEPLAGAVAKTIIARRPTKPLSSAHDLADLVSGVYQRYRRRSKIHPATKVFQALRIAVNDELNNVAKALPLAVDMLRPGGKLAVVTFHSGEDRIVKNFFRQSAKDCVCPPDQMICICDHPATLKVLGKPQVPNEQEIKINPKSRSAKLRLAQKI